MNLMELCLQGVPFLDGELIGAKKNCGGGGSGEETVCLMVLKWNLGVLVTKDHIKISSQQDSQ